jgi:membrane-bound lytic murein transglycosylase B
MRINYAFLAAMALLAGCASLLRDEDNLSAEDRAAFRAFYASLRQEVALRGLSPDALDASYGTESPRPVGPVLKAEKKQPEVVNTFAQYTTRVVSPFRVEKGQRLYTENLDALEKVQAQTGVSASVITALWGVETSYGSVQGDHPVIPALVTLAWKSHRGNFFKNQVFDALKVSEKSGKAPAELKGSWAGAMGQCQFMPSNYLAYGRDGNGDSKVDIWATPEDVFASAGTFLHALGWQQGKGWKFPVTQKIRTSHIKLNSRGLSAPYTLAEWKNHGLKQLPEGFRSTDKFRLYRPEEDGPTYLLSPNFDVILGWNNSSYFVFAVLTLADKLAEPPTEPEPETPAEGVAE